MPLAAIRKWIAVLVISIFSAAGLPAAEIGKIDIVQEGGSKLSPELIQFNLQLKAGGAFDENVLNSDIKRLYETGYFADVLTETTDAGDGKINITIKTIAHPTIKNVYVLGNVKFDSYNLMRNVSLNGDQPLNNNQLRDSARKLREFYREKGYNDAQVVPEVKTLEDGRVDVIFQITENLRLKVDHVTFEGNTVYSNMTLRNTLANRWSLLSRLFEVGLFDPAELNNDKARLRELYLNKGFLDFKVEDVTVTPQPGDPEYVDLHFKLYEGEPYKVGEIKVEGDHIFDSEQLLGMISLKQGDTFDNRLEQESNKEITGLYQTLGHADVSCSAERTPNYETKTVDLKFIVYEGRKYEVNEIHIVGNKRTKTPVILRDLVIQPGDPLDNNRIEASKERLMGMGYFKNVEAVSINTDDIGKKDVTFEVEEKETFTFKVGAGYSSEDSLVGMAEISNSNFDITDPKNWFYGGGQRFRIQGMFGIERMGFNVDFAEPWLFGIPLRLDTSGYWNEFDYEYWREQRGGGKFSLTKNIFDDFTSVAVGYKIEHVRVFKVSGSESQEMRDLQGNWRVSQPSLSITRDTRDNLMEPTSGYYLNAFSSVTPRVLGSSDNYYRVEAKGSYYYSFFDKAIVAHVGGKIGTVSGFNHKDDVPVFERYFLGGGDSLRGFPFREVSPTDSNGHEVGGNSMLLMTAEVSHPIWDFIRGAVFVDAGNVWSSSYRYNLNKFNVGAGYGLRIKVPYFNAPIKLDLAYPILNDQEHVKSTLRFHFNMGVAF
jgi:outer membrane protein insertion porin family